MQPPQIPTMHQFIHIVPVIRKITFKVEKKSPFHSAQFGVGFIICLYNNLGFNVKQSRKSKKEIIIIILISIHKSLFIHVMSNRNKRTLLHKEREQFLHILSLFLCLGEQIWPPEHRVKPNSSDEVYVCQHCASQTRQLSRKMVDRENVY